MARPERNLGEKSDSIRDLVTTICKEAGISKNSLIRLGGMLAERDGKSQDNGKRRVDHLLYGPPLTLEGARRLLGLLHVAIGPGARHRRSPQKLWRRIHEIDALLPRNQMPFGNYAAQPCIVFFPRAFTSEIAALWRKDGLRETTVQRAGKILYRQLRKRSERFEQDFEYFQLTDEEHDQRAADDYYETQAPREDVAARWAAQEAGESEYWSEMQGKVVKLPHGALMKARARTPQVSSRSPLSLGVVARATNNERRRLDQENDNGSASSTRSGGRT